MNVPTGPQAQEAVVAKLLALSERADGGTWDFQEEMTEFYNDAEGNSCGGHPTGNFYIWDKDGPNEDDAWIHPHHMENVEFICALVNWFRANAATLATPARVVSDESIRKAARALCKRSSDACGVDFEDNWKLYYADFEADARAALSTIQSGAEGKDGEVSK